jgi:hypothetical protein
MTANKMIPYDNSRSYSHGLSFSNSFSLLRFFSACILPTRPTTHAYGRAYASWMLVHSHGFGIGIAVSIHVVGLSVVLYLLYTHDDASRVYFSFRAVRC